MIKIDTPYTQHRESQFRGPTSSDSYNDRIEENYKDLVVLYNKARVFGEDLRQGFGRFSKDQLGIAQVLQDLETRVTVLEKGQKQLAFTSENQVDNDRFNGTAFEINSTSRLSVDSRHGVITLPQIDGSTVSKLYFANTDGTTVLPSTLQTTVTGVVGTADTPAAIIDTSEPEQAIVRKPGRVWERNVVVGASNGSGAALYLYLKTPTDLFTTANSNTLFIHPYPVFGTDLMEVAYTTKTEPLMADSDGYTALNTTALYSGTTDAVGHVPPGGWNGDADLKAGPRGYYFPPIPITGLRIKLRQMTYYRENGMYVYSYGLSLLDLLYTKFLSTGKTMIRYNVSGTTSSVTNVQSNIWNIAQAAIPDVFSYRVIWETAFNSGVYTTTPVSNSSRFWIEVSLSQNISGVSPALSSLTVTYS